MNGSQFTADGLPRQTHNLTNGPDFGHVYALILGSRLLQRDNGVVRFTVVNLVNTPNVPQCGACIEVTATKQSRLLQPGNNDGGGVPRNGWDRSSRDFTLRKCWTYG